MKSKYMPICAGTVCMALASTVAHAGVLFSDNFNSYASGSNINGQGGWYSNSPGYFLQASHVSQLGSQAVDGRQSIYNIHWMYHSIGPADADAVTVLSFDAFAFSGNPPSTNSGVGLQTSTSSLLAGGAAWWDINADSGGWSLDVRTLTGNDADRFTIAGHWDERATFRLVVDGVNNEIFGIANFGGPNFVTPRYSVTDSQIAGLNTLTVFQDYQLNVGRTGAAFDNVSVSSSLAPIPEPSTYLLMLLGLGSIACTVRRSQSRPKATPA